MAKRLGKKTKVSVKGGNDYISLFILVVVIFVFATFSFGGFLTGRSVEDFQIKNEVWKIDSCNFKSAEDSAVELKWAYGCSENYCHKAAYGLELPYDISVKLNCQSSDQISQWESHCNDVFEAIC